MKISLELLFHYRCDHCDRWQNGTDVLPSSDTFPCMYCHRFSKIEGVEYRSANGLNGAELMKLAEVLQAASTQLKEQGQTELLAEVAAIHQEIGAYD